MDVQYYRDEQNIAFIHYIQKYPLQLGSASWKTENGAKMWTAKLLNSSFRLLFVKS